jgi:hypothetical protein
MPDLPIAVSERMGGRARLPALQIFLNMAKWRIEVKRTCTKLLPEYEQR